MRVNKKLNSVLALLMAACAAIILSACGTVTEAATSPGSQSSTLELTLTDEDLKGILEIPEVYVIQGASNVSFVKAVQFDESIVRAITSDPSVIDSALEGSRSLKLTITVDQQAMATKLGLENAADYTGQAEIQVNVTVKVVSADAATQILAENPSAIVLDSDNAAFRPETETGADNETGGTDSEPGEAAEVTPGTPDETDANTSGGSTGGNSGGNTGGNSGGSTGGNSGGSTGGNSGGSSGGSTTQQPSHTHNWQPVYGTVHHDEVGHYETQTVSEAWDEPVYEYRNVCSACGASFVSPTEVGDHIIFEHNGAAAYSNQKVQVDTIHHEAVTQEVWVVDQAAYDEQVITGYKCSCGATK